jgi:serine phosphatase RsbU (regulator of sigma subunit)/anti-sigma regulatory factor (Ser/Thr protein kinase)
MDRVYVAKLGLIAAAYYGSAKLGLNLAFETASVTAVWPPTGIALAAVVLWGYRMWPGIAAGALLANSWTGIPLVSTLGITCGNTLEALAGAFLLQRVAAFQPSLERVRDVLALVILAAGLSTTLSATIGVLSLVAGDEVAFDHFASVWRVWWLGDMGGDLIVAPALLVAATHYPFRRAPGRSFEALALGAAVIGLSALIFSQSSDVAYLVFPLLIWAALRFWQPGAAAAGLVVAIVAVAFSANDEGPFMGSNPDETLLLAQTFVGVAGVTALLLAAVVTQRRRAEEAIEHVARTLQESLLPARLPEIPGVDAAARFRPAGLRNSVGGDFYDVFGLSDGSWAVVVGDVCGKGPEAAALTGLARHTLRAASLHEIRPSRLLTLLNDTILRQHAAETFCTAGYVRLELDHGGTAQLTFSTGGHPLPLLLRAGGEVEPVGEPGMLLGIEADPGLTDHTTEMQPGDTLLLYTDGLTDAYAPARMLGDDDIAALLRSCAGLSATEIAERIQRYALGAHPREPRDDIALVVLRVAAEPVPRADKVELRVHLAAGARAPASAREAIHGLARELDDAMLRDVELLASELVTNSVRHAQTAPGAPIELLIRVTPDAARVEVTDAGKVFGPRPQPAPDRAGGWGLHIVERIADRWGIGAQGAEGGTSVWFEIDRGGADRG